MPQPPSQTHRDASIDFSDLQSLFLHLKTPYTHPASDISFANDIARSATVLAQPEIELVISGLRDVERIIDTISSAQAQIDALASFMVAQKVNLESIHARYRTLIAPIRALPTEVLQVIFMLVWDLEGRGKRAPSVVAQVNQYWRRVALDTPSLWTTIVLPFNPRNAPQRIEELETRMQRTGARLVSLTVLTKSVVGPGRKPWGEYRDERRAALAAATAVANAILPYTCRLESLTIRIPEPAIHEPFLDVWQTTRALLDLTNLKELELGFKTATSGPQTTWTGMCTICNKARNLRKMFITEFKGQEEIKIPSNSLKAFRCALNIETARSLFTSAAPKLQLLDIASLAILADGRLPIPDSPYPPLPNLTTLVIRNLRCPSPHAFPPLPALQHLIIDKERVSVHEDGDVRSMLRAWGSNLRYLAMPADALWSTVHHLFQHFTPKLEAINIPHIHYLLQFIPKFGAERASLPQHLSHIELDLRDWAGEWDGDATPLELLCERARDGSIPQLTTLTLFLDRQHEYDFEVVKRLVEKEVPLYSSLGIILTLEDTCTYFSRLDTPYLRKAGASEWYNTL